MTDQRTSMTGQVPQIVYCPTCMQRVLTLSDGRCQWCLTRLVKNPKPAKQRKNARHPDGICLACHKARARAGRTRCALCERSHREPIRVGLYARSTMRGAA